MSVSPFLPGNSIWSNNGPLSRSTEASQQASTATAGGIPKSEPSPAFSGERNDANRLTAHPLPNKPSAPNRSNSSLSTRTAGSEDQNRSSESAPAGGGSRHGAVGTQRGASARYQTADISRSNSVATSFQSFRSASAGSPLPGVGSDSMSSRSTQQFTNLAAPVSMSLSLQSPSLPQSGQVFHDRDTNASGETEFGTPRLFLDGQQAFFGEKQGPPLLSRSQSGNTAGPKARPSSWMHPSAADPGSDRVLSPSSHTVDAPFQRPASSQGNHTNNLVASGTSNAYPFPATGSNRSGGAAKRMSAQILHNNDTVSSSPIEGAESLNYQSLFAQQQAPALRSNSPAIASNPNFSSQSNSGRGTPTLNVPPHLNLSGGLLSPTAATVGSSVASAIHSPVTSPISAPGFPTQSQRSASAGHVLERSRDDGLADVPLIKDVLERLTRVEGSMKDFSRQISGISRNVSLLLERTKGLPPSSLAGGNHHAAAATPGQGANPDELRSLNAQVNALANSVSHLLTLQGSGVGASGSGIPQSPLAGLGIGGPASAGMMGTPQIGGPGGIERSGSPHVGMLPNGQFVSNNHQPNPNYVSQVSSPRPNGNNRGWSGGVNNKSQDTITDRRWSTAPPSNLRKESMGPGTPNPEDMISGGNAMQVGTGYTQPNAIISKWEHLNLQADLLRSILKYGLGPPNKIQQRALPFLLRGSDIIAQAPPTQERIASYVIPALQLVLNVARENAGLATPNGPGGLSLANKGPIALIVSTTVDQATQAQRMALGLGAPCGIRVHIVAAGSIDVHQEAQSLVQSWPHIVVGTPQKMSDLFTYITNNASSLKNFSSNGVHISPSEVRLVVLDEVDQLIARNLADHVSSMLRVLPAPTSSVKSSSLSPGLPQGSGGSIFSPFEQQSPDANGRNGIADAQQTIDRQIALFSNTVPQDVLNFAQSIHLRESVRVLVRRDGGASGAAGAGSNLLTGGSNIMGSVAGGPSNYIAGGSHMIGPQRDMSQPSNALGAHPVNSSINAAKDPVLSALKGLRQYYLYVAVTSNNGGMASPIPGMHHNPAGEMKLDLIADLLEDIDFGQSVIYCANVATQEAVIYKLSSKGIDALGLNREMNSYTRQQTLVKFRSPSSQFGTNTVLNSASFAAPVGFVGVTPGSRARKALVVCDMAVHPKEVHQIPLILFYDMPRSVEEYKEKISCAAAGSMARPSVCVNVVTASGGPRGDVEMLRTLECHLGCKMAELPMDPKQILNF